MCEAHFHAGQYLLIAGQTDGARSRFEKAGIACRPGTLEGNLAAAELARSGTSKH
jgi:hypothetical protein